MSLLDALPEDQRKLARRAAQPEWTVPMAATLTDERFSDPGWIFERKLDGERCLAFRGGGEVRLLSRNRLRADDQYPEVAEALTSRGRKDFIVDGEVVAFDGRQTSFAKLQRRMHVRDPGAAMRTGVRVFFYLFDVLHVDGHDVTQVALLHRKALLRRMFEYGGPLRFTSHRRGAGEAYWNEACGKGWEGVIAKRADAAYEHRRSRWWLKFKCAQEQEFVIGGWTDPQGSRRGFGALLIGYYRGKDLVYAGKVGTGFDERTLADMTRRLSSLERKESPFAGDGMLPRKGVHWAKPMLVGQIGYSEWTPTGRLRHPRFMGLRRDKAARDVVRERPA